ncbi:hypothetical protein SSAG_01873 [Streptomyces sp. Mg1]|nr:hypothetical protein SSAG_01873 [Streptomyces sp. Mg1]
MAPHPLADGSRANPGQRAPGARPFAPASMPQGVTSRCAYPVGRPCARVDPR